MTTTGRLGSIASRLGWIVLGTDEASDATTVGTIPPGLTGQPLRPSGAANAPKPAGSATSPKPEGRA